MVHDLAVFNLYIVIWLFFLTGQKPLACGVFFYKDDVVCLIRRETVVWQQWVGPPNISPKKKQS